MSYKLIRTKSAAEINLPPKVVEALISAGAGGIAGSLLGGVSAALIPANYDVTHSDFKLDGTMSKRRKYKKKFKRDPIGQSIRSGIMGLMIGGAKPFVEQPIRDWLLEQGADKKLKTINTGGFKFPNIL